jgi:hypothetical protein
LTHTFSQRSLYEYAFSNAIRYVEALKMKKIPMSQMSEVKLLTKATVGIFRCIVIIHWANPTPVPQLAVE